MVMTSTPTTQITIYEGVLDFKFDNHRDESNDRFFGRFTTAKRDLARAILEGYRVIGVITTETGIRGTKSVGDGQWRRYFGIYVAVDGEPSEALLGTYALSHSTRLILWEIASTTEIYDLPIPIEKIPDAKV